jgi:hypothetical protein
VTQRAYRRQVAGELAGAAPFLPAGPLPPRMPATLEVRCTEGDCELDMFEMHYTYDMPDSVGVADFSCPYCGTTEGLEEIEL